MFGREMAVKGGRFPHVFEVLLTPIVISRVSDRISCWKYCVTVFREKQILEKVIVLQNVSHETFSKSVQSWKGCLNQKNGQEKVIDERGAYLGVEEGVCDMKKEGILGKREAIK